VFDALQQSHAKSSFLDMKLKENSNSRAMSAKTDV